MTEPTARYIALRELHAILGTLLGDLQGAVEMAAADGTSRPRRHYIRSGFALIEGTCFRMKQIAHLLYSEAGVALPLEQEICLLERSADLNDNGTIRPTRPRLGFRSNTLYSLRSIPEALSIHFSPDTNDQRWALLLKAVAVRDRLVHPKAAIDLEVHQDELNTAREGFEWFMEQFNESLKHIPAKAT
jgi:hypothetical protein